MYDFMYVVLEERSLTVFYINIGLTKEAVLARTYLLFSIVV
jgi:hypothetical protein